METGYDRRWGAHEARGVRAHTVCAVGRGVSTAAAVVMSGMGNTLLAALHRGFGPAYRP
jgi:hypothetical protein